MMRAFSSSLSYFVCSMDPVSIVIIVITWLGSVCFDFVWFVPCVQSVLVCLLFLLVSLVGYITKTCLYNFDPP